MMCVVFYSNQPGLKHIEALKTFIWRWEKLSQSIAQDDRSLTRANVSNRRHVAIMYENRRNTADPVDCSVSLLAPFCSASKFKGWRKMQSHSWASTRSAEMCRWSVWTRRLSWRKNVEKVMKGQTTHISRYQVEVSFEIIMNHLSDLCLWALHPPLPGSRRELLRLPVTRTCSQLKGGILPQNENQSLSIQSL